MAIRVEHDLLGLARALKAAGHGELLKEMLKSLRVVAKEITPATRRAATVGLPAGGGLNKRVARAPQRITARAGRTSATVAVNVSGKKKGTGASGADEGRVAHPVFGNREAWAVTKVEPGWFTDTAEQKVEERRRVFGQILDATARKAGFR